MYNNHVLSWNWSQDVVHPFCTARLFHSVTCSLILISLPCPSQPQCSSVIINTIGKVWLSTVNRGQQHNMQRKAVSVVFAHCKLNCSGINVSDLRSLYHVTVKCSTRHDPTHPRTHSSPAGDSSLKAIEKLDETIHENPAKKNNLWQVT